MTEEQSGAAQASSPNSTAKRTSKIERAVQQVQIAMVRLEAKVNQALSFRPDAREENERLRQEMQRGFSLLNAQIDGIEGRVTDLEKADIQQGGYWATMAWVRDAILALALAVIGAGVYLHG